MFRTLEELQKDVENRTDVNVHKLICLCDLNNFEFIDLIYYAIKQPGQNTNDGYFVKTEIVKSIIQKLINGSQIIHESYLSCCGACEFII